MPARILFLMITLFSMPLFGTVLQSDNLLFVIHAKEGKLTLDDDAYGTWKLSLEPVDESVAFFSEAPDRKAGTFSLEGFLDFWMKHSKGGNAGFIFFEVGATGYNEIPIEVRQPVYHKKGHRLTFDVHFLKDALPSKKENLNEVTLFVDIGPKKEKSFPSRNLSRLDQALQAGSEV